MKTASVILHPTLGRIVLDDLDNDYFGEDAPELDLEQLISESEVLEWNSPSE